MFPIKAFNVHATWQTKSGRKGKLSRVYIGDSIDDVFAKVRSHLRADRRFDARHELDIQIWESKAPTENNHV